MKLWVKICGKQIFVKCEIKVSSCYYIFALANTLKVFNINNNEKNVLPRIDEYHIQFLPQMKKYEFDDLEKGILSFEYNGILEGDFLFMQEELHHFSLYNAWYPMKFDAEENYDITLLGDDSFELINGFYTNNNWKYITKNQSIIDCNILFINKKKSYTLANKNVFLYYFDIEQKKYMDKYFECYSNIFDYYVKFYGEDKIGSTSIVFLPEKYKLGAYKRDHLIVYSEVTENVDENMHRLAHEMAHSYSIGANVNTWEDWLNETHAEWSALLYEIENDPLLFEKLIDEKLSKIGDKKYSLKPNGNERPDNVHEIGTLIYYELYLKYGIGCIKMLLKTFNEIQHKNTKDFIDAIYKKDEKLANILKCYIDND